MKPEWKEFLAAAGAEFDDCNVVRSFGNAERERRMALSGTVFADLSHEGLVAVRGTDAPVFLQSQFANDIRQVSETRSQLSAYCDAKGRMLADFRIIQRGDTYYLKLPLEMVEPLLQRLQLFVLRSDVSLEDASEAFVRIGVSGAEAAEELTSALGSVPEAIDDLVVRDSHSIVRVPGVQPRFEVFATLEAARELWDALNVRAAPVGAPAWQLLDILAGIPVILPATMGLFVPQMANMERLGAISFHKGCYPGQEIVARTQYLGKLKRRMYLARVRVDGEEPPHPGDALYFGQDPEQSAGRVVNAQPHPDGGHALLAVIQTAGLEQDSVHLRSADGPALEVIEGWGEE